MKKTLAEIMSDENVLATAKREIAYALTRMSELEAEGKTAEYVISNALAAIAVAVTNEVGFSHRFSEHIVKSKDEYAKIFK